jgi:hypothetical protein
MIAICTVCRRENGVRCPRCTGPATKLPNLGPYAGELYICASTKRGRHRHAFQKQVGGITHHRHLQCPPTNRLELEQTPDDKPSSTPGLTAEDIMQDIDRAVAALDKDTTTKTPHDHDIRLDPDEGGEGR